VTVRDFIIFVSESPDIETDQGELQPQEVIITINGKEHNLAAVWVRGDNKLILEATQKN